MFTFWFIAISAGCYYIPYSVGSLAHWYFDYELTGVERWGTGLIICLMAAIAVIAVGLGACLMSGCDQ